ncbi:MAG: hypothetical protein U0325_24840 [Polyangiales bacterium]
MRATLSWLLLGCASSTPMHWVPGTPWDEGRRPDAAAQEAAIILQDHTDLRLRHPRFDAEAVRGAGVTACAGASCERLRRTLTVARREIAWMSLRYGTAVEARAASTGAPVAPVGVQDHDAPVSSLAEAEAVRGEEPCARHAVYLSATSLVFSNGVGLNYSYRPIRAFAVSVGGGVSTLSVPCWCLNFGSGTSCGCEAREESAGGGQAMAHLLLGGASVNFELGLGLAVVVTNSVFLHGSSAERVSLYPSVFVGLRVQPVNGGILVRFGGAWEYGLATGISASVGAAF